MKKIASITFLLAFLIGAEQPVLPLIDYHFNKESILELFCENRNVPESDCEGMCYLTKQIQKATGTQEQMPLINAGFYPIGITPAETDLDFIPLCIETYYSERSFQPKNGFQGHITPPPQA